MYVRRAKLHRSLMCSHHNTRVAQLFVWIRNHERYISVLTVFFLNCQSNRPGHNWWNATKRCENEWQYTWCARTKLPSTSVWMWLVNFTSRSKTYGPFRFNSKSNFFLVYWYYTRNKDDTCWDHVLFMPCLQRQVNIFRFLLGVFCLFLFMWKIRYAK